MAGAHRDVNGLLKKHGYQEIKKIGEGSFGKALLVQNAEGNKLVCKMVDISGASAKERQDAQKESKLLASFKHPYIVRYRDNFADSGWLCILMDFCDGGDLCSQIEKARKARVPLPEQQVLVWMTQAMLALKYIHDVHVLHRDLKSGNFFLTKHGVLKMGDFGIAKVLNCTAACARTQIGTPYYLSPEVCQEKPYTWPSDVWAMGVIFYEMCERKVPFDAPNISGLVQKIVRGPTPVIGSPYSDFVRNLGSELLNRNPNLRPTAESVIQRPQIQACVRVMLEERRGHDGRSESGGGERGRAHDRKGIGTPRGASPSSAAPSAAPRERRQGSASPAPPQASNRGRAASPSPRAASPSPSRPSSRGASPTPVKGHSPTPRGASPAPGGAGGRHDVRPPGLPKPSRLAAAGGGVVNGV